MRTLPHLAAALAAALSLPLPALAADPKPPPAASPGEPPCEPVKPCEAPMDDAPAAAAEAPADFTAEAKLLYAVVSCSGAPLPAGFDAKVVQAFCAKQKKQIAAYRDGYLPKASAFLAKLRPAGLPTTVVYPFGGGDLLSALTTYPDARNVTTLSLEHAGDPRRLAAVKDPKVLADSLEVIRQTSAGLLTANDSKTENLMKGQRGEIPGQLAFFMTALAIHGYEPVSLKFFRFEPDGTIHYLTATEIAASEKESAKLLRGQWVSPDFSPAFSNSEITFVKKGEDPRTQARVHRHVAADLSDGALAKQPGILKHLASKGRFVAMTKAASYLLWRGDFSKVRNLLLERMVFMISDSTGIPPAYARKAGFVQETYGTFEKSYLDASPTANADFVKLWTSQPKRALPVRYGYLDGEKHYHLLVTRKP
ncbi:hypothetical protein [Anaeromyxobacter oryzae]|uniref:Lipoprotein n=1 Tax=Anaeromyxobacter oryzae TaxID=2918170 RepID=A0ABN6MU43_9BACT|nr:hypothetical protein [Anaeromyxobacter oryzae]BDG03805.1 hypothetical protein AMOR_28010 [Anaeromyxobacter oryzae]